MKLILTCEHGGNFVPAAYVDLFKDDQRILESHRGYDIGALDVFNFLEPLAAYYNYSQTCRLLIELNRSLHHKDLFSKYSKNLSTSEKEKVIEKYYTDYRREVEKEIGEIVKSGEEVFHLSIHSFTPVLNLKVRQTEVGILYDPANKPEKKICASLKLSLHNQNKDIRIRFNYPYQGKSDGFTTYLRKEFPENYCGIELELNQKLSSKNKFSEEIKTQIYNSIENILKENQK